MISSSAHILFFNANNFRTIENNFNIHGNEKCRLGSSFIYFIQLKDYIIDALSLLYAQVRCNQKKCSKRVFPYKTKEKIIKS